MRAKRRVGVTVAMLSVLALSGCSAGSGDDAATTQATSSATAATSTTSSSSSSKSPTTPATPSSKGTAAGAPGVPEPARQHTKAGAVAFARHYVDVVNKTAVKPKVGLLEPLALASCKSCDNHESTVEDMVAKKRHFSGPEVIVKKASVISSTPESTLVEIRGREPRVDIVDDDGNIIKSFPEVHDQGVVVEVKWTNGWRVATLKTSPV